MGRLEALVFDGIDRWSARVALVGSGGETLTYEQLAARAETISADLRGAGHVAGGPVVVAVDNRPDDLAAQLGVWRSGGTVIPLHTSTPEALLQASARRSGSAYVVSGPGPVPDGWRDAVVPAGTTVHRLAGTPTPVPAELDAEQALVIFTSGSTGLPKGVVLAHDRFVAKLAAIDRVIPHAEGDATLQPLHLNFSFGQWTSLLTLASGGTLHLLPRLNIPLLLDILGTARIERVPAVPSMLRRLLREIEPLAEELGGRRGPALWIAGGEPLAAALGRRVLAAFPDADLADVYGLSETSTSDLILAPGTYGRDAGSVGVATGGVEAKVVDDQEVECAPGEPGELRIRTEHLMTGYLDDPASTRRLVDGGWVRTGDLALVRPSGAIELVGRRGDLIFRGGAKVSPLEVEEAYFQHTACTGAAVVGLPDDDLGQRVAIALVLAPGASSDPEYWRAWGAERLDSYKVPERFAIVDELFVGRTGKTDRRAAATLFGARADGPVS